MKKVLAIIGSPRKGETLRAVRQLEEELSRLGGAEFEYLMLQDVNLGQCRGCLACLERGEEYCPVKGDDRDEVMAQIMGADAVILAAPVYSLQVPALTKNFLDRFAFVFHRPRFFGLAFMAVVTQGVWGRRKTLKYLEQVAWFWGFNVVKGVGITTPPGLRLPSQRALIDRALRQGAIRFKKVLDGKAHPRPGLFRVFMFRIVRAGKPFIAEALPCDFEYFRDKGWLESDYYYQVRLGPLRWLAGALGDRLGTSQGRKSAEETQRAAAQGDGPSGES